MEEFDRLVLGAGHAGLAFGPHLGRTIVEEPDRAMLAATGGCS